LSVTDVPPPSAMDPRLRARRISVRRDEGRRRLRRVIALGAVAAIVLVGLGVTQSPLLDVDRVTVTGAAHTPPEVVRAAAGIRAHRPMTSVDLDRARQGVLALPWVQNVSVSRSWPSSIHVKITERTPVGSVAAGPAGFAVVDRTGRVLETSPAPPAGMAVLANVAPAGAPGTVLAPEATDVLTVATSLLPPLVPKVAAVAAVPDGVELQLVGGGVVRLGPATDVLAKLVAADTVLSQVQVEHLCALDVRVASAPSLTQGGSCA
jgi:cell division protein FtsQ